MRKIIILFLPLLLGFLLPSPATATPILVNEAGTSALDLNFSQIGGPSCNYTYFISDHIAISAGIDLGYIFAATVFLTDTLACQWEYTEFDYDDIETAMQEYGLYYIGIVNNHEFIFGAGYFRIDADYDSTNGFVQGQFAYTKERLRYCLGLSVLWGDGVKDGVNALPEASIRILF